ncbi:MAG TPA: hypothetical protein VGG10_04005 [Rhizomicrobium sp.]|jgi:hypothetical protein
MFIGHYGVSFAAKQKPIPLWLLFLAVQFLDVVWSVLVMLGIEKLRIIPGITAANALDLYYMPYTHGLPGALLLSALFGAASAWFIGGERRKVFWITAAAVFSHWVLDLIVHAPDMPLVGNAMKVGFGLWNYPWLSLPLELVTLWAGAVLFARNNPAARPASDAALWGFVVLLTAIELYASFGPDPASPLAEAHTALAAYLGLAALAALVDRVRRPVTGAVNTSRIPPQTGLTLSPEPD